MNEVLAPVKWQIALVFRDDIVSFSKTPEKYIDHVRQVLTLLQKIGVTLMLKKCWFYTNTSAYIGHVIWPRKLEVASYTTEAIKQLKESPNVPELCLFVGLWNVFRRFIPDLVRIVAPHNSKLQNDQAKEYEHLTNEEPRGT